MCHNNSAVTRRTVGVEIAERKLLKLPNGHCVSAHNMIQYASMKAYLPRIADSMIAERLSYADAILVEDGIIVCPISALKP